MQAACEGVVLRLAVELQADVGQVQAALLQKSRALCLPMQVLPVGMGCVGLNAVGMAVVGRIHLQLDVLQ